MEFIKKHWKEILIGLLIVFSLNKCTVACNRDTKINKQQIELVQKDSIIKEKTDSLKVLNIRWTDLQSNKSDLVGVALDTKQELSNQVHNLESDNILLNNKIKKLESENSNLRKENKQLKDQLNK